MSVIKYKTNKAAKMKLGMRAEILDVMIKQNMLKQLNFLKNLLNHHLTPPPRPYPCPCIYQPIFEPSSCCFKSKTF